MLFRRLYHAALPVRAVRASSAALRRSSSGEGSTHFGNTEVPKSEKPSMVQQVFSSVASNYDVMNDLMSGGLHRLWKDGFVAKSGVQDVTNFMKGQKVRGSLAVLDLAGGTGDIGFRVARALGAGAFIEEKGEKARLVISDVNEDMLEVGKSRAQSAIGAGLAKELEWAVVDAMKIPYEDESFDLVTIAFGLRNVTDQDKALGEIYRVLRPGGRFMCLEFTPAVTGLNPSIDSVLDSVYRAYSFNVIPRLGAMVAGDADSYQYLVESIRQFPPPELLATMMREAGFRQVVFEALPPGVVAIHSGYKL